MPDDSTLLRRYASERSEAAFAELVRRHVDLVYSAALRRVGGDPHSAADVAGIVGLANAGVGVGGRPHRAEFARGKGRGQMRDK